MIDSHQPLDIIEALEQQPISGWLPKGVEKVFPNATLVIDRFHVMQAANKELNQIRRQDRAQNIFSEVTTTIRNHLDGICNYFRTRTTSGPMAGINNRIKLIRRQAYGFVNFRNFRKRLLACFSDQEN